MKISQLIALLGADAADNDLLTIVDTSATKTKKITVAEARIALVTAARIIAALGFTPADAAAVGETPTGTGYVHVTDGEQDEAAADPLTVAATDANATLSSSATVTGSGDATVGMVAQTATGTAAANLGAAVTTLGNATFQLGSQSITSGNATTSFGAYAVAGNAAVSLSATVTTLGDASANTTATSTTAGNATATATATAADGVATSGIVAVNGAHTTSVIATSDETGGALEIKIDGDVGAAGQFVGVGVEGTALWQTPLVRHAAGVPTGAPGVAELPFAFDSTAVTGGLYFWDGAAWVKCSTIP